MSERFGGYRGRSGSSNEEPGFLDKSSRGSRRGKWKPKPKEDDIDNVPVTDFVIPEVVETPTLETIPDQGTPAPEDGTDTETAPTSEESVVFEYKDIPVEILEKVHTALKGKSKRDWVNTPAVIANALRTAGLTVKVLRKGTPEKRGDDLELSWKQNGVKNSFPHMSTGEAVDFLESIISTQYMDFMEKVLTENGNSSNERDGGDAESPKVEVEETAPVPDPAPREAETPSTPESENVAPEQEPVNPDAKKETAEIPNEQAPQSIESPKETAEKTPPQESGTAPKKERQRKKTGESTKTPEVVFDDRFTKEFGISKNEWEHIAGHEKLSGAQQKLVLENLREFSTRDKTPFLEGVWQGIRSRMPGAKTEDAEKYLPILKQLVESSATYGPKVYEEKGELLPDFIDTIPPREKRAELKPAMDMLNKCAHALAKTPASWLEDGIGTHSKKETKVMTFLKDRFSPARKQYQEYQKISSSFESAKQAFSEGLLRAGYEPAVIAAKLVEIDKKVYELQFQQTSPDAVEEVKNIPDTSMWREVGRSFFKGSNLGYMGLGFVGRVALSGVMGVFAAPTVSALIAGSRAWNRTAAELRERDRAARSGVRDTSDMALNIVSAERVIEVEGKKVEVGVTKKLDDLIEEYRVFNENEVLPGTEKENERRRSKLLISIRARAQFIEDKQKLNRINFGTKEQHAVQMAKLYESLTLAQMIVADNQSFGKSALDERLGKLLFRTEQTIQNKRRLLQVKKVAWNALRAGAFSRAGGMIAEQLRGLGQEDALAKLVRPTTEELLPSSFAQATTVSPEAPTFDPEFVPKSTFDQLKPETPEVSAPVVASTYQESIPAQGDSSVMPEVPKTPEALSAYTVKRGDTLTKILKEHIPEIRDLGPGKAQENAIANIVRSLSPEELKIMGIDSGNPNLIIPGRDIDLSLLQNSIESQQSVIDSAVERFGEVKESLPSVESTGTPGGSVASQETYTRAPSGYEAHNAMKVGVLDSHFSKEVFGREWNGIKGMAVEDYQQKIAKLQFGGAQEKSIKVLKELMDSVAKPPMKVTPERGETMEKYLGRAYTALVKHERVLPTGSTLRKILSEGVEKITR